MTAIWAIATNKGGIGKTTLTINLGAALRHDLEQLQRVLTDVDRKLGET